MDETTAAISMLLWRVTLSVLLSFSPSSVLRDNDKKLWLTRLEGHLGKHSRAANEMDTVLGVRYLGVQILLGFFLSNFEHVIQFLLPTVCSSEKWGQ